MDPRNRKSSVPLTITPLALKRFESREELLKSSLLPLPAPPLNYNLDTSHGSDVHNVKPIKCPCLALDKSVGEEDKPLICEQEIPRPSLNETTLKRSLPVAFSLQPRKRHRQSISDLNQETNTFEIHNASDKNTNSRLYSKKTRCFLMFSVIFAVGFVFSAILGVTLIPFGVQDLLLSTVKTIKVCSLGELLVHETYQKVFTAILPEQLFSTHFDKDNEDPVVEVSKVQNALLERIHGQEEAISVITNALNECWTENGQKPLIFLFEGTSGTGKTLSSIVISSHYPPESLRHFSVPFHFNSIRDEELEPFLFDIVVRTCSHRKNCCLVFDDAEIRLQQLILLVGQIRESWTKAELIDTKLVIILVVTTRFDHSKDLSSYQGVSKSSNLLSGKVLIDLIATVPYIKHVHFALLDSASVEFCIQDEFKKRNLTPSDTLLQTVLEELELIAVNQRKVSKSGCKHVHSKVDLIVHKKV